MNFGDDASKEKTLFFFLGFFVGAKSCTGRTKNDSRFRMQAASVKSIKLINCVNRKFK